MSRHTFGVCAIACAVLIQSQARASIEFSGSGNNPEVSANASGKALFTISGNTLTLVLTNTTSPRTAAQGNAMTGAAFNINGASPTLVFNATTGIALSGASKIWTSETSSNTSDSLATSWTATLGASPLASYGVATTGFNGRFQGGSIGLGNASPDYGIVAGSTFDGADVAFGGSQFPFIQDSLVFTFTGLTGISESQIEDVKLLFGTDGTGIVNTTVTAHAPEATSMVIWLGLAVACGCRAKKRWRAA